MSSQNPCLASTRQAAMDSAVASTNGPCAAIRCLATSSVSPWEGWGGDQSPSPLLDLGAGACVLQLLQDGFGLFAVDTLLDRLGRLVGQVLGFLEAQAGDFPDDLDHANLGVARRGQHHLELGLLGFWSGCGCSAAG